MQCVLCVWLSWLTTKTRIPGTRLSVHDSCRLTSCDLHCAPASRPGSCACSWLMKASTSAAHRTTHPGSGTRPSGRAHSTELRPWRQNTAEREDLSLHDFSPRPQGRSRAGPDNMHSPQLQQGRDGRNPSLALRRQQCHGTTLGSIRHGQCLWSRVRGAPLCW